MSEQARLLAAVVEAPDDDAPRLVYADWLEDNGQPERAEFIRAQLELARLPEGGRRPPLEEREKALLAGHRPDWLKELPTWARSRRCEFRRGFVAQIESTAVQFLKGGSKLVRATPLEHLKLQGASDRVEALASSPALVRLRELDLFANKMTAEDVQALARSPHLASLTFLGLALNRFGPEGMVALAGSPALAATPSVAGLRFLGLRGNGVWAAGARELASSPHLNNLVELELGDNPLGDEGAAALAAGAGLRKLSHLSVAHSNVGEAGARALAATNLPELRRVSVGNNPITREGMQALRDRFGEGARW